MLHSDETAAGTLVVPVFAQLGHVWAEVAWGNERLDEPCASLNGDPLMDHAVGHWARALCGVTLKLGRKEW